MSKRKRTIAIVVLSLYLFTWSGGWLFYARDLGEEMSNTYERVKQEKIRRMEEYRAAGEDPGFFTMNLVYEDGPQWQVGWCVPLLPGILLVDSAASCGPLSGGGHRQFVFFYGYGTTVLCNRDTWRQ